MPPGPPPPSRHMSEAASEAGSLTVATFSGSDAEWDEVVGALPGANFCHLSGWRHVVEDVLGHEVTWLSASNGEGTVVAVLPLARVRSRLFGDYLLSMPFLSYGGPVGSTDGVTALVERAVAQAADSGVDLLELRAREPLPGGLAVSDRKLTVLKALPDSHEELWKKGIKAKVRSQVKRPMKEGMEARHGLDLVEPFYGIFSRTMRDLGTPVLPRGFFEALAEHFPNEAVFTVVEHQGRPAAAACGFAWGGEYEITWAGADRSLNRLAPNMLLYWSVMEEAIRRGVSTFNFGRCTAGSGTHKFKRQWGAEDHPLPWAQWSPGGVAATPNPDSAKFRLATRAWSRLPLPVANTLGPFLSRSLP